MVGVGVGVTSFWRFVFGVETGRVGEIFDELAEVSSLFPQAEKRQTQPKTSKIEVNLLKSLSLQFVLGI